MHTSIQCDNSESASLVKQDKARGAWNNNDHEASRRVHDSMRGIATEHHMTYVLEAIEHSVLP